MVMAFYAEIRISRAVVVSHMIHQVSGMTPDHNHMGHHTSSKHLSLVRTLRLPLVVPSSRVILHMNIVAWLLLAGQIPLFAEKGPRKVYNALDVLHWLCSSSRLLKPSYLYTNPHFSNASQSRFLLHCYHRYISFTTLLFALAFSNIIIMLSPNSTWLQCSRATQISSPSDRLPQTSHEQTKKRSTRSI